ncbi:hypothetical protein [Candidatus Nitrosotenuis chungbukensis]|uniref:hypothetical protein n=1 Tax=Candidatus Nitrosotenuis chungbukensis TaxID=1353246 RepID=UPI0012FEFCB8|nr:hypothetical protein [Candidatus Nitrosotenuis chungbukensis]
MKDIQKVISSESLNSISFDDAITKTYFFHKLISSIDIPTIYLDFDLLYSGYVAANILPQSDDIRLFQPTEQTWSKLLVQILDEISKEQHIVIIDSLNGFYNIFTNEKDAGRLINSFIMLLVSIGQKTKSIVLVGSLAKFKKDEGWVLLAIGRHVIEANKMNRLVLQKQNSELYLTLLDQNNSKKSTLKLSDLDLF